jgi:hypothetical protein
MRIKNVKPGIIRFVCHYVIRNIKVDSLETNQLVYYAGPFYAKTYLLTYLWS